MNKYRQDEMGSTLVCALCTILVISVVGANVLMNCTTRYNVTSKQVTGWKDALCAAEAGADIAFAETRKVLMNPGTQFTGANWTSANVATGPWTFTTPSPFGAADHMTAKVAVDNFTSVDGYPCYRIRSVGTARVPGLRRVGMDDRPTGGGLHFGGSDERGRGDSLLRKIDFNSDHFIATYGDGDGNNKQLVAVPVDGNGNPLPRFPDRVEAIAVPILPVSGAIKTSDSFYGPAPQHRIDSFNSSNGPYDPSVALAERRCPYTTPIPAMETLPAVAPDFTNLTGDIYGNVTTNGGTVTPSRYLNGTVDNNVPVTILPQPAVTPPPLRQYEASSPSTLTPPVSNPNCSGNPPDSWANAPWYSYSEVHNVVHKPGNRCAPLHARLIVNIVVNGDVRSDLTINRGVNVRIYFAGNVDIKVSNFRNQNVNGSALPNIDGTASPNHSASAHVQFYGVSPTAPATQTINLDANGNPSIAALWYAPGADFESRGQCRHVRSSRLQNFLRKWRL